MSLRRSLRVATAAAFDTTDSGIPDTAATTTTGRSSVKAHSLTAVPPTTKKTPTNPAHPSRRPSSDDSDEEEGEETMSCPLTLWYVLSWLVSIMLYVVEYASLVLTLWSYAIARQWLFVGLNVGFLVVPTALVMAVSLVWYCKTDQFHRDTPGYKGRVNVVSVVMHFCQLGVIYR